MSETHSLNPEEGKLHMLEYYVSKATELNDMMDQSKAQLETLFTRSVKCTSMTNTLENMWSLVRAGAGLVNFLNYLRNTHL